LADLKGTVAYLSSFTLCIMSFQTPMISFLQWSTKQVVINVLFHAMKSGAGTFCQTSASVLQ